MDNAAYTTLTRQSGLMREMQIVANNIANAATTGFRQEGLVFSEHVKRLGTGQSLSMASANIRQTSQQQGALVKTNAPFDLAIEGEGYFLVETPAGERLTRAGSFAQNLAGELVTADGFSLLDQAGAPVFVPPLTAPPNIAADGTISIEGDPVGQIGIFVPANPLTLTREDGVMFATPDGVEPRFDGRLVQGFLEQSNVDPIGQIARMIEVQRAYEMGQKFLSREDERIRDALKALSR